MLQQRGDCGSVRILGPRRARQRPTATGRRGAAAAAAAAAAEEPELVRQEEKRQEEERGGQSEGALPGIPAEGRRASIVERPRAGHLHTTNASI